jgi:hypothetical protein
MNQAANPFDDNSIHHSLRVVQDDEQGSRIMKFFKKIANNTDFYIILTTKAHKGCMKQHFIPSFCALVRLCG